MFFFAVPYFSLFFKISQNMCIFMMDSVSAPIKKVCKDYCITFEFHVESSSYTSGKAIRMTSMHMYVYLIVAEHCRNYYEAHVLKGGLKQHQLVHGA